MKPYKMYTTQSVPTTFSESKYVADILSSMANGEPITPSYPLPGFLSGVTTATTPTLTPTTLANIEKTFIELQSAPVSSHDHNALTQSGFVPPVVDPVTSNGHSIDRYAEYSDDPDWMPGGKRSRMTRDSDLPSYPTPAPTPNRKGGRRRNDEKLAPEEEHRRSIRRERNKLAAAKCRQRRVDHTNILVKETEKLEGEKSALEDDIQSLQKQRDQLEFILKAHQPLCKVNGSSFRRTIPVSIKQERSISPCSVQSCDSNSSQSSVSSGRPSTLVIPKSELTKTSIAMTTLAGIPITTPSNGLFTFGPLDNYVDSNGIALRSSPTCGSQVHRASSESSTDAVGSPTSTLISL